MSKDSTIKVTDLRMLKTVMTLEDQNLSIKGQNTQFAVSPDGQFIVVGDTRGKIYIFNVTKNGELAEVLDSESGSSIVGCVWDPCHTSRIATIDDIGGLFIWE